MWCFSCQAEVQSSDSSSGAGIDDVASSLRPKVTKNFIIFYCSTKLYLFPPMEGFLVLTLQPENSSFHLYNILSFA